MAHFTKRAGKKTAGWYGLDEVQVQDNPGDPDLIWNGYTFNYWDIESALWEDFLEETGHTDDEAGDPLLEAQFGEYVRERAVDYLKDVVYGGYFQPGSKTWHTSKAKGRRSGATLPECKHEIRDFFSNGGFEVDEDALDDAARKLRDVCDRLGCNPENVPEDEFYEVVKNL
mgnify:CR=1 FL=1